MHKILSPIAVFSVFVLMLVMSVIGSNESYVLWDYANILFLNVERAEQYQRPEMDIVILLGNLILMSLWISTIFSRLGLMEKGLGYWIVARLGKIDRYITYTQGECWRQGGRFLLTAALCLLGAAGIVNLERLGDCWRAQSMVPLLEGGLFVIKLVLMQQLLGLIGSYLLLRYRYELIYPCMIIGIAILWFADMFGCAFLRWAGVMMQLVFILILMGLYAMSYVYVSRKIHRKELW